MNLRLHFQILDEGMSRLLGGLMSFPADEQAIIRELIDNDEYGHALEILIEMVRAYRIRLSNEQTTEVARISKLMGFPPPGDGN